MNISTITVTYNPEINILLEQINSLLNEPISNIIIVDNGSNNIESIQNIIHCNDKNDKIILLSNYENKGLGYAQNQGIIKAKELGTEHVLILDQDSILEKGMINNLFVTENVLLLKGIKTGAIGPKYYSKLTGEIYPITKYIGPFIKRIKPDKHPVEASFLISSGCLIRLSVIDDVGYMNSDLFIDYIDVEWSFRARNKGYKLFVSPNALMSHSIGDKRRNILGRSISEHSILRRYYLYRNSMFMIKCPYISFGYKLRELTFNFIRFIVFLIYSKQKLKYLKFGILAYVNGIRGKMGKCFYEI
jgi:rhamnosyltransferase